MGKSLLATNHMGNQAKIHLFTDIFFLIIAIKATMHHNDLAKTIRSFVVPLAKSHNTSTS
jgi:hypothetical protein